MRFKSEQYRVLFLNAVVRKRRAVTDGLLVAVVLSEWIWRTWNDIRSVYTRYISSRYELTTLRYIQIAAGRVRGTITVIFGRQILQFVARQSSRQRITGHAVRR